LLQLITTAANELGVLFQRRSRVTEV